MYKTTERVKKMAKMNGITSKSHNENPYISRMAKVIRESGTDKQGLQVDNLQCCIQNHSCSKTANGQKQPKYLGGLYQQHTTTMIQSWYSSSLAPSQNPNLHF